MKTLLGLALAIVLIQPASAGLVQFNAAIDVATCPTDGPGFCVVVSQIPDVTMAVGDTVDFTVTFGGSRMTLFDDDGGDEQFFGWLFLPQTEGFFTISDATIDFVDLVGTLASPLAVATQTGGAAHIGPAISADFIETGSSISFAGYHVHYTVDALPSDPNSYGAIAMFATADRMQITSSVPEPATLALLVLPLMGLALTRKRRC